MALARWQSAITDDKGNVVPAASITVRAEVAGAPLANLFSDREGLTPLANPFNADAEGFAFFHVAGGAYRIDVQLGTETRTHRYVGVGLAMETDASPSGITFRFDQSIADSDPGSGRLRFNNGDLASVSQIYVSDNNQNGIDVEAWLSSIASGSVLLQTADGSGLLRADATGAAIDGTDYWKIPVSVTSSSANGSFIVDEIVGFASAGDGTDGVDGVTPGARFTFDSATDTTADPGTGELRMNDAAFASVTEIAINDQAASAGNPDVSAWLQSTVGTSSSTIRGAVKIEERGNPANFGYYNVTALVDETGFTRLTVTHLSSNGTISNGDALILTADRTGDKGDQGNPGTNGTNGTDGEDGLTSGLDFDFDDSTSTGADPGTGNFRMNNAAFASVTEISINQQSSLTGNPNVKNWLLTFDDSTSTIRGHLLIRRKSAPQNFGLYHITALADDSTFVRLTVTHVDSNGSLADTELCDISFARTGDRGDGTGNAWSDPVDATITPDVDNTRDLATDANRFANGFFRRLNVQNTATGSEQRSLRVDINGAGFDEITAQFTQLTTGALSAFESQTAHAVFINKIGTAATSYVYGLTVFATSFGGADVWAVAAGAGVGPIDQLSGGNTNPDLWDNNGTDETSEVTGPGTSSVFQANGDYVIIGESTTFQAINVDFSTPGDALALLTWEYSTGVGTWQSFNPLDLTFGFTQDGIISWAPAATPSWAVGASGNYEIRATRGAATLPTTPVVDTVVLNNSARYTWDADGDLTPRTLQLPERGATVTPAANEGTVWVENTNPNRLMFTDGAGTDKEIAYAGGAFHDGFSDFVADEHVAHSSVEITAGQGLVGGGAIDATRTIDVGGGVGIDVSAAAIAVTANTRTAAITIVLDGGGAVITTGVKGELVIPFACTIQEWVLVADQGGAAVVDIWKDTYANYPPDNGDSITAAAPPTIVATNDKATDDTLTGWTTSIAAGDILRFNVDSVTTIQRLTLVLEVLKT